ncbi:hypothetical protein BDV18DRAFT_161723 [Aspergillus unguis]
MELLQAEVDSTEQSFLRLLVHGRIKYLTIEPHLYSDEDMCFAPSLFSILPPFPPGDWNDGLIAKDPSTGLPHFAHAIRTQFPSVKNKWHSVSIDYSDLKVGKKLRTGIYEVTSPRLPSIVVAKFARFEWEIGYLDNETAAYEWIDGQDISPKFLGHLTEGERVIGFLMERVVNARHAGPGDLPVCQGALARLHMLGIRHGDINRFNFLVRQGGAVLIDFDTARKCDDQDVLRQEFEALSKSLKDTTTRGGGGALCVDKD